MIRRSFAACALAIALVMTMSAAEATPIFSNYRPAGQYGLGATGLGIAVADPFVAGIDASLISISLSLSHQGRVIHEPWST